MVASVFLENPKTWIRQVIRRGGQRKVGEKLECQGKCVGFVLSGKTYTYTFLVGGVADWLGRRSLAVDFP